MPSIAIYGAGQLGTAVAAMLREHGNYEVLGPYNRDGRAEALGGGADVVIIATTTRLSDVAGDIALALQAGSNVLISAEECAYPFVVDRPLADRLNNLAIEKGVSIAGCGVNPGLIFDALVLTLLGAAPRDCVIEVARTVDISGFGAAVLRRIGLGRTYEAFVQAVGTEEILGHAGFPQSMSVVAGAVGLNIERIDKVLLPVITPVPVVVPGRLTVAAGESAGVDQTYTAFVDGRRWFTCRWLGHIDLAALQKSAGDDISLFRGGALFQHTQIRPAIGAQTGSQNMVTNSISRIIKAPPGWVTVGDLVPAFPAPLAK